MEPIAALITILLTGLVVPLLPYLLSFAAGAMIYVVVEELIPEAQAGEHSNISTVGVAVGVCDHDGAGCCLRIGNLDLWGEPSIFWLIVRKPAM